LVALGALGASVPSAPLRLAGSVLIGTHDEWLVSARRHLSESSMAQMGAISIDSA
jgi:hypothetical protein